MSKFPKSTKSSPESNTEIDISGDDIGSNSTMFKYWVSTFYWSDEVDKLRFIDWIKKKAKVYYIGFEQCPTTGRDHLQVFFEYNTKRGVCKNTLINAWPKTYFRRCYADFYANTSYCGKSGVYITNVKELKLITEFLPWHHEILDLLKTEPDFRTIHWYYENEGCTYKTALAKYICVKYKNVALIVSGKSTDCKNAILQFHKDKKEYPEIIIFDIPRCNLNHVSYEALESIKNGLFYSGKYEGGMCIFNNPHIICFANEEPEYHKLSEDRWHVVQIGLI